MVFAVKCIEDETIDDRCFADGLIAEEDEFVFGERGAKLILFTVLIHIFIDRLII